uniref:SRCR domain-containing protein n=1 Tax=Cyprinus carpio TaxID=7962 RepID=A0A8C1XP65_CYPCA
MQSLFVIYLSFICPVKNINICTYKPLFCCCDFETVRLVGGNSSCSGRVEVLYRGQWGTVCHNHWDKTDVEVVCRELDCGEALNAVSNANFGQGSGPIWMDQMACSGSESTLKDCRSLGWGVHNCGHHEDAVVICSGEILLINVLVGSGGDCAGRLEVFHSGSWGTVCDDSWDIKDAHVVCRQLQCGVALSNQQVPAWFGPGSGPIWLDEVECEGNETSLWSCSSPGWGKHDCQHKDDVGVVCSEHLPLRLRGGEGRCSGRLEVYHNAVWGSVCDDQWDISDAQVVCRQLGCGAALRADGNSTFGVDEGGVWMNKVECRGNEIPLWDCPLSLNNHTDCSRKEHAGLTCAGTDLQLVGGHSRCSGRVEVLHRGQWGTVCDLGWGLADAAVVCRELDCGEPVDALGDAHFGQGSGPIWMSAVCTGSESTLKSCWSGGWGKHNCDHSKDAGVICSEVRLVGGSRCSGRLEILHNQMWMSVCDAAFDQQDAEVVCRELDCGAPVKVLGAAAFDKGDTQMWTQEIQCRGNESQIHLCPISLSVKSNYIINVRLVNGSSRCAGRVEVLHRGQWGTVCDAGWDLADAAVVCRELDCGEPVDALVDAHSGPVSGPVWIKNAKCTGSESTLKKCGFVPLIYRGNRLDKNVQVICSGKLIIPYYIHNFINPTRGSVRLVGGSRCSGRLEILHNQTWMSVCEAVFDQQDAEVVCREMDCGAPVQVLGAAAFGKGAAQMWTQEIQCRGNESQIHLCPTSPSHENNCSQDNGVGLVCHFRVRLVGGSSRCAGRVEVLHRGQWGTVCGDGWDLADAAVVCRELDSAAFDKGDAQMWTQEIQCRGNESQIHLCPTSPLHKHNCSRDNYQRLLILFLSRCAGRVEVLHRGQWGTVCHELWDMADAAVVCRELDCGEPVDALGDAHFGPGSGPIWMSAVLCTGSESSLKNCGSGGWSIHTCYHNLDASVICSEVVCRELDCGAPVQVLGAAAFGKGDAQMWTQEIQCRGNESLIQLCSTSHDIQCSQENNVGLICSGKISMFKLKKKCIKIY